MSFEHVRFVAIEEDLGIRIRTDKGEEVVALLGVDASVPMDDALREKARTFLERVLSTRKGMRILWEGERRDHDDRRLVYADYFVAQDKSGNIWFDAGAGLVGQGLCPVDDRYPCQRRQRYKRYDDSP